MKRTEAAIVRAAYAWYAFNRKVFGAIKYSKGLPHRALSDAVLADKRAKRRRGK